MASTLPIAITFTDRTLTLVQLESQRNRYKLRAYAELDLPEGLVVDGEVQDSARVAEYIQAALKAGTPTSFSGKQAVLHLPEQKTFLRALELPTEEEAPIAERIPWMVDEQIPLPIEKMTYDWHVTRRTNSETSVQVAAAPTDLVEESLTLLQEAGLAPAAVEPTSSGLYRAIQGATRTPDASTSETTTREDVQPPVLYLSLASSDATFVLLSPEEIIYTSSISLPHDEISSALVSALSAEPEAVASFLRSGHDDQWDEEQTLRTLKPFLDTLATELSKVLSFAGTHSTSGTAQKVNQIVLSGPLANLPGVDSYLSLQVGTPISKADVLTSLPLVSTKLVTDAFARAHAIAFGLAARAHADASPEEGARPLNLLPRTIRDARALAKVRSRFITSSVAIVMGALVFLGYLYGLQFVLQDAINERRTLADHVPVTVEDQTLSEMELLVDDVNALASRTQQVHTQRLRWTPFLVDLAQRTPENVRIASSDMSIAPEGVRINGFATTREEFLAFVDALGESPYIVAVTSPSSNLTLSENLTFVITVTLDQESMRSDTVL